MSYESESSRRKSGESLSVPPVHLQPGRRALCTPVKALKSDQAVRGENCSCRGASHASIGLCRLAARY